MRGLTGRDTPRYQCNRPTMPPTSTASGVGRLSGHSLVGERRLRELRLATTNHCDSDVQRVHAVGKESFVFGRLLAALSSFCRCPVDLCTPLLRLVVRCKNVIESRSGSRDFGTCTEQIGLASSLQVERNTHRGQEHGGSSAVAPT